MKYLVTGMFNQASTDAILALIPAEITREKGLAAQGVRRMLYIPAAASICC